MISEYALAIDLGQAQDHTALSIIGLEVGDPLAKDRALARERMQVLWLEHYPKGTRYHQLIDITKRHLSHPKLEGNCRLLIDRGEVGKAVIEDFQDAGLSPIGIQITSGNEVHRQSYGYSVPKRDLVWALVAAFTQGRVDVYESEPGSPEFIAAQKYQEELAKFGYKTAQKTGRVKYEALGADDHDDLVMSTAMGIWYLSEYGNRYDGLSLPGSVREWDTFTGQ